MDSRDENVIAIAAIAKRVLENKSRKKKTQKKNSGEAMVSGKKDLNFQEMKHEHEECYKNLIFV